MQHKLLKFILAALCLVAATASAQSIPRPEDFYRIEVLVFERLGELRNELYHLNEVPPELEGAVELLDPDPFEEAEAQSRYFAAIDPELRQFNDHWVTLEESPDYRPLAHLAWDQPQYPFEAPQTLRLHGGDTLVAASHNPGEYVFTDRATSSSRQSVFELDGTAAFSRGRFMHLGLDLVLRRRSATGDWRPGLALPRLDAESPSRQFLEYRLSERLRIRSDEVYYFDNKHFGAIAIVTHPYSDR